MQLNYQWITEEIKEKNFFKNQNINENGKMPGITGISELILGKIYLKAKCIYES